MATNKKAASKTARRDSSPEPTNRNETLRDAGIRLSPARTPKKLLRNKKRKELIESLSPSQKSSKKSKKTPLKVKQQDKASSSTPSILSFFAKAKPVQHVECPVCSQQVPVSKINKHLDSNCLTAEDNNNDAVAKSREDSEVQSLPRNKKGKAGTQKSPGRKLADLKMDKKDKRTRLRLKKKIESHTLYQNVNSTGSESVLESESDLPNADSSDVEVVSSGQAKKKVHRELFSDDNNTNSPSGEGRKSKARGKSKLSLNKNHSSKTKRSSKPTNSTVPTTNPMSKKTNMATGDMSPYWQCSTSSSDDCKIFKCTPAKDGGLSPSKKLSEQMKSTESCDQNTSGSKSTESDDPNQRTFSSTTKSSNYGALHKDESRTPKKLTPVFQISPAAKAALSSKIVSSCNSDVEKSPGSHQTPMKRKYLSINGDDTLKHRKISSSSHMSSTSASATNSPTTKPHLPNASQRLSHTSPQKSASYSSPNKRHPNAAKSLNSPSRSGNSPGASTSSAFHTPTKSPGRSIYSPHRFKPSSAHSTPVNSPMKSSQLVSSPAPSSTSSTNSPSKRDPYYLVNFKLIFLTVLGNEDDRSLFSDEDLAYVNSFKNLSGELQRYDFIFFYL